MVKARKGADIRPVVLVHYFLFKENKNFMSFKGSIAMTIIYEEMNNFLERISTQIIQTDKNYTKVLSTKRNKEKL